jgi:hypothetical protein
MVDFHTVRLPCYTHIMRRTLTFTLVICFLTLMKGKAQRVMEFNVKPTEFVFLNFESGFAIGTAKKRYGFFISYRPSTQDSGLVKNSGSGAAGGYGHPHYNKLYSGYTLGLYQKTYFNKIPNLFLEANVFFRNWSFENKSAEFRNVEGNNFKGLRTENVDVYGLKLLAGKTIVLAGRDKRCQLYVDLFIGVGIRHKIETYETFNGYVNDTYHVYKKEKFHKTLPTPQSGVKLGLLKTR